MVGGWKRRWAPAVLGALACLALVPVAAGATSSPPAQLAPVDEATTAGHDASVPTTLLPPVTVPPTTLPPLVSTPQTLLPPVSTPVTLPGVPVLGPAPSAPLPPPSAPGSPPRAGQPVGTGTGVMPAPGSDGAATTEAPAGHSPVSRPSPGDPSVREPAGSGGSNGTALRPLAAETARQFGFPLFLAALVVAFLAAQHRIDERDAKLAAAVPVGARSHRSAPQPPTHPSPGTVASLRGDPGRPSPLALVDDDEYVSFS